MLGSMSQKSVRGNVSSDAAPKGEPLDRRAVAQEIEENLKRVYQATLTEEVPDRFLQLLAQLRDKEKKE